MLAPVARALHLHTGNTSARIKHTMKQYSNAEDAGKKQTRAARAKHRHARQSHQRIGRWPNARAGCARLASAHRQYNPYCEMKTKQCSQLMGCKWECAPRCCSFSHNHIAHKRLHVVVTTGHVVATTALSATSTHGSLRENTPVLSQCCKLTIPNEQI